MRAFYWVAVVLLAPGLSYASGLTASNPGNLCSGSTARYGSVDAWADGAGICRLSLQQAAAEFQDSATILGPSGEGFVSMDVGIKKRTYDGSSISGHAYLGQNDYLLWATFFDAPQKFTFTIPIVFGTSFSIGASVSAAAIGSMVFPQSTYGEGWVWISSLTIFDANHTTLSNFSYSTESGQAYNVVGGTMLQPALFRSLDAVLVPEPSLGCLLAGCLAAFAMRRRGR